MTTEDTSAAAVAGPVVQRGVRPHTCATCAHRDGSLRSEGIWLLVFSGCLTCFRHHGYKADMTGLNPILDALTSSRMQESHQFNADAGKNP